MAPPEFEAADVLKMLAQNARWDQAALSGVRDITAVKGSGRARCVLTVTPDLTNRFDTLHGGCIATLVDTISTIALLTVSTASGMSVDLNVSYLNAAKAGEDVVVEARVLKVGRSTSAMVVDISVAETGRLVAQGRHTKFMPGTEVGPGGVQPPRPRAKL